MNDPEPQPGVEQIVEEESHSSLDEVQEGQIRQTWNLFNTKRMRFLIPLMTWTGISNSLYQATLTSIMIS
jgi:hypothetical protein